MNEPREHLEERLAMLRDRLEKVERRRRGELSRELDDQSLELEDSLILDALELQTLDEIKQMQMALERVERGQWGVCAVCGQTIPEDRLEAMPWTDRCLEHAAA